MGKHRPTIKSQGVGKRGRWLPTPQNQTAQGATQSSATHKAGQNPSTMLADQWSKPMDLSSKFDILTSKGKGDLTIGLLNVRKLGRVKRTELADTLQKMDIDCLAVVEHHVAASVYDVDKYATKADHKSLSIKGYKCTSKHRDGQSGGVAWFWKKGLNCEIWEGPELPVHLKEAGRERCWIKVHCSTGPVALAVVYMPTESTNTTNERSMTVSSRPYTETAFS